MATHRNKGCRCRTTRATAYYNNVELFYVCHPLLLRVGDESLKSVTNCSCVFENKITFDKYCIICSERIRALESAPGNGLASRRTAAGWTDGHRGHTSTSSRSWSCRSQHRYRNIVAIQLPRAQYVFSQRLHQRRISVSAVLMWWCPFMDS